MRPPIVSPEAEQDLDEMEIWLTDNWGPLAAANAVEAVLERISGLADMPSLAHLDLSLAMRSAS